MNNSIISEIEGFRENRMKIFEGIEFELEKLLDLKQMRKEAEKLMNQVPNRIVNTSKLTP